MILIYLPIYTYVADKHYSMENEWCSAVTYLTQVIREGTQDQIAYFGQTPSQLLTSPHIKRMPLDEVLHMQVIVELYICSVFLHFSSSCVGKCNHSYSIYIMADNFQESFSCPVLCSTVPWTMQCTSRCYMHYKWISHYSGYEITCLFCGCTQVAATYTWWTWFAIPLSAC